MLCAQTDVDRQTRRIQCVLDIDIQDDVYGGVTIARVHLMNAD